MSLEDEKSKVELHAAWDEMIESLQQARNALDQPELMPAPSTSRNLAEGYRYLMGYVHSAIERAFHEDPQRPIFRNALSIITRATIDNADAIYFYTAIDGRNSYVLKAKTGATGHWRGEDTSQESARAPHYVIFECSSGGLSGDTGNLGELRPGVKTGTGTLDSSSIKVEADGSFEILFAPEKPVNYSGNFVPTLKVVDREHPTDPTIPPERYADYISGRQLFSDWETEEAIHFEITQLGGEGLHREPYSPEQAIREMKRCGDIVNNQLKFWNAFWTIPMGTYGERQGSIPGVAFQRNAYNRINAASGATAGGMSSNIYAGGVFEIEENECLVITIDVPEAPNYTGFQLGNLWGESLEYANQISSLNGTQMVPDSDGKVRLVVAHSDPGVANWVDTTGHLEGFMTSRWAYSEKPPEEKWPTVVVDKIAQADLRAHLPADTATVTPAERRAQIAIRQRHVQRRFRAF